MHIGYYSDIKDLMIQLIQQIPNLQRGEVPEHSL